LNEPSLVLNGEGTGPVNNLCVPSLVSPDYAPQGQHLISLSVLQDSIAENLESKVVDQMHAWYGNQVEDWEHLRTYRIAEALPNQAAGVAPAFTQGKLNSNVYLCGDFCTQGSLNAAMYSGRLVAEELSEDFATAVA
jgi:predicted NAD/FAD-dependent oxidoreductase